MSNVLEFRKPDFGSGEEPDLTADAVLDMARKRGFGDVLVFGSSEGSDILTCICTAGSPGEWVTMLEIVKAKLIADMMGGT